MPAIPAEYQDLLQQKVTFAHLATIMPNGTPQVTPVWFDYTNGKIRVNSAKGRVKVRYMREGAPVALSILDPDNPYRYIQIRGRVPSVPMTMRQTPPWSLPLRAEVTSSHGHAAHPVRKDSCRWLRNRGRP